MYYIDLTYLKDITEVKPLIPAHTEWMDKQFAESDIFIASGPKKNRAEGGFFIVKSIPRDELDKVLATDPLYPVSAVTVYDVEVLGTGADEYKALLSI